jgi:twinkle protein
MNKSNQVDWDTPLTKGPCNFCASSDAASIFTSQETGQRVYKCHSCGVGFPEDSEAKEAPFKALRKPLAVKKPKKAEVFFPDWEDSGWGPAQEWRGITRATLQRFGVEQCLVPQVAKEPLVALSFPYYASGDPAAAKVRWAELKDFTTLGSGGEPLFGMHLFPPDANRTLFLCEGEADALAAWQMLSGKYPVVSIRNGAPSALKDAKAAFDYLNGWEKVIIMMDNDPVGKLAQDELTELLGTKAYVFQHSSTEKDACDYLMNNRSADFYSRYWKPVRHTPDGIIGIKALAQRLKEFKVAPIAEWPFPGLQRVLKGIFAKRLYTITAGSGTGKSTFCRGMAHHLWKTDPSAKIGMMFLEESAEETLLHLVSQSAQKAAHQPDTQWEEGEIDKHVEILSEGDRYEFWDHFDEMSTETIFKRMEYMNKVLGVNYIFFDHVGLVTSGAGSGGDERKDIDSFMTKLRHFVEGSGITVFNVSHLARNKNAPHEEGGEIRLADLRGSGGIGQLSDVVIALERNQQDVDETLKSVVLFRVLKNRPTGTTGPAGTALYSLTTDSLTAVDIKTGELSL